MRIDLHVHSKFSRRPSAWLLKKIGCPESFTEPLDIFRIARGRGMDAVTITDHNCIDGALEIAHLPGVFISEEVTTYFPDDRCKLHVLALDINERQHEDIQKVRPNVFELVDYLNDENIVNVLAHPLYRINGLLTTEHLEQLLLLFRNFEINGARNGESNQCLRAILKSLTPAMVERLSDRHGIISRHPDPWIKVCTGGSDDHSSLHIACTSTQIETADSTVAGLIAGIQQGRTKVVSEPVCPATMAHNFYGIAYQFYRQKFKLDRYINKDMLIRFLDHTLLNNPDETNGGIRSRLYYFWNHRKMVRSSLDVPESLFDLLRKETHKLLESTPQLMQLTKAPESDTRKLEKKWFDFVNQISNGALSHFGTHLLNHLSGANLFNIFNSLGSGGSLYTLLSPYFVAFSLFAEDRKFNVELSDHFKIHHDFDPREQLKVAHFTDTLYEVNGVALTLRQQAQSAIRNGKQLEVITCQNGDVSAMPGVKQFKPVGVYDLPEYRGLRVFCPPLLEMLDYCYKKKFTRIHIATPGPIGLAALAIARILRLPVYGTYHTSLPQYAGMLTGESFIEDLTWRYMIWYYEQMDLIYAPSESTRNELAGKGISKDKIRVYPRGIDIRKFHPSRRNGLMSDVFGIPENRMKLLYVGRVSSEKNLDILSDVFRSLCRTPHDIHLVIVGDGPYLEEMKRKLADTPCTFTGYLKGEKLSAAYASSDIFVFPSTTDTFGNVVLEAQASGLPVIVTDQGGPRENMLPDQTGRVVQGDSVESFYDGILSLLSNPQKIVEMGQAARNYMEERSFDAAFIQTWEMYRDPHSCRPARAASA